MLSQSRASADRPTSPSRAAHRSVAGCSGDRNQLALRHLRGYSMRSYQLQAGGLSLTIAGPMRPEDLLDESRIERRCAQDDYMPYWANLWPASVALADYLLQSRLVPPDNNGLAVELGCGLGMPAVAAGLLGWQILLSDYDADALAFAEFNAAANGLQRFAGVLIDWRHLPQRIGADLVLGADVLYEPRLHQTLLSCINGIVAKDGVAILADPRRCGAKGFRWTARNAGWTVHMQAWADSNDRLRRIPVDLYILTRHR